MQVFKFGIQYRPGNRMAHVDFLSRSPVLEDRKNSKGITEKRINLTEITDNWLLAEQQRDEETSSFVSKLRNGELPEDIAKTFELRGGTLYRKIQGHGKTHCLPIIPKPFRWSAVNNVHEAIMHLGWEKTLAKMYEYYWFDKMSKYVRKFVDNCITCRLSKPPTGKVQAELHPIPKVSVPFQTVHIYITGKLSGKNVQREYIIVQIDAFSKFVHLFNTTRLDSESCIKSVRSLVSIFGVPSRVCFVTFAQHKI